ncbi:MAG: hypothetical protein AAGK09_06580 [Planctomycetota bacterium]
MLRFFRRYFLNKYVLVFLGVILMAVFGLGEPLMTLFRGPAPSLGVVHGQTVRLDDERQAMGELRLLSSFPAVGVMLDGLLSVGFDPNADDSADSPAMRWIMIQSDAERLGLQASQTQVAALITAMGGGPDDLQELANAQGVPVALVEQTLARFIVMLDYADLVAGRSLARDAEGMVEALTPQSRKVALMGAALQQQQFGRFQEAMGLNLMAQGSYRLSDAVLALAALSSRSVVSGEMVVINAAASADREGTPDESIVAELFEAYRDDMPGEGQPFGFGYRTPDRVKFEYLSFPVDTIAETIEVDEAAALEYFRANQAAVRDALGNPDASYADARDLVIRRLTDQLAQAQALALAREVQGLLSAELRGASADGDAPETTRLTVLADRLEGEHGFRPNVTDLTNRWIDADRPAAIGSITSSNVTGRANAPFGDYLRSVLEFGELDVENPSAALRPLGLAVGLPSQPMVGPDGSAYVFRITEAQPARSAESIDEVREIVERDARLVAAYRALVAEADEIERLAIAEGLEGVADAYNGALVAVPPMPRRIPTGGGSMAPPLPGIGSDEAVSDAMHDTARDALTGDVTTLDIASPEDRLGVAEAPGVLSLAVFRVDELDTLTRGELDQFRAQPVSRFIASAELVPPDAESPLSFAALARRTGFQQSND